MRIGNERRGFTLVELLVAIAIIMLLAGIAFPILGGMREKGRQTACASNLHQLYLACRMYAEDYDGYLPIYSNRILRDDPMWDHRVGGPYPAADVLHSILTPYAQHRRVWYCPSDPIAGQDVTKWGVYHLYSSYCFWFRTDPPVSISTPVRLTTGQDQEPDSYELIRETNTSIAQNRRSDPEYGAGCEHFGFMNTVYLDGHMAKLSD